MSCEHFRYEGQELQYIAKGTTAEIYTIPQSDDVLKVFPLCRWMPSTLTPETRLTDLLTALQAAQIPLLPDTTIVDVSMPGYSSIGIRMRKVTEFSEDFYNLVVKHDEDTSLALCDIIGRLHGHGIVIDHLEKGIISSHVTPQLLAIMWKADGQITVIDWTNLALVQWFPGDMIATWIHEAENDLRGYSDYSVLFNSLKRRELLQRYCVSFERACGNENVIQAHRAMIQGNLGLVW